MSIQRPNSFHGNPDGVPSKTIGPDVGSHAAVDINVKPGKRYRDNTYTTSWREYEQLAKGPGATSRSDFITPRTK